MVARVYVCVCDGRTVGRKDGRTDGPSLNKAPLPPSRFYMIVSRAPEVRLTRRVVRWIRFFKPKSSSMVLRLQTMKMNLFRIRNAHIVALVLEA